MFRKKDPIKRVFDLDEKGELKWFTSINPQRFIAVTDMWSIVVGKRSGGVSDADEYTMEIRDDRGRMLACASSEAPESEQSRARRDDLRRQLERVFRHASETAVSDGLRESIEKIDRLIAELKMRKA